MPHDLFDEFFNCVNLLIQLLELAPLKTSQYGIKHNLPDADDLEECHILLKRVLNSKTQIFALTQQGIKQNKTEIDKYLYTFRGLSRYMDERSNLHWSAYHPQIDKCLDDIHDLLIDIDTKYHLGQHKTP
jgi:hypothetical protein